MSGEGLCRMKDKTGKRRMYTHPKGYQRYLLVFVICFLKTKAFRSEHCLYPLS